MGPWRWPGPSSLELAPPAETGLEQAQLLEGLRRATVGFEGELNLAEVDRGEVGWQPFTPSMQFFELRASEKQFVRINVFRSDDPEDLELDYRIAESISAATPLDEGASVSLEFVDEIIELGEFGELSYMLSIGGDPIFITALWIRCGYIVAVMHAKTPDEAKTHARAIDAEIRDNWCPATPTDGS